MTTTPMDQGRGTFAYYGTLPGAGSSILLVALKVNEAEATLTARATLAAVLAAANTEANFTNYARIAVTVGVTVGIASHVTTLDIPDQTWASAGGTLDNLLTKVLACYKPSAGAADSAIIPLAQYDFPAQTDGSNLTAQVNASGLMSAA